MSKLAEKVQQDLVEAIDNDDLVLPTLPEVALQIRKAAEDPEISVSDLSKVIGRDTALSARLIKVVNSPLLRAAQEVTDLHTAITRLGTNYSSNLAIGLVMEQIFHARSEVIEQKMRDVWRRSLEVAGVSYALCRSHSQLKPDQAALGGLVFGSVSVLFSTMALLLSGPGYGFSDSQIGLVGLLGIAGVITANLAGRLTDRGRGQIVSSGALGLLLLGWLGLYLGGSTLYGFLLALLLMDVALPAVHISNQSVIYKLAPQARARVNAVYMTAYFTGAASGSALGALAWSHGGWGATCTVGAVLGMLAWLVLWHDQHLVRHQRAD